MNLYDTTDEREREKVACESSRRPVTEIHNRDVTLYITQ